MTTPIEFSDDAPDELHASRQRPRQHAQRGAARSAVLRVFAERPNQVLFVDDLAELTGFTPEQVRSAVYNARSTSDVVARDCEVIQRGTAWRWVATQQPPSTSPTSDASAPSQPRTRARERSATRASRRASTDVSGEDSAHPRAEVLELVCRLDDGDLLVQDDDNVVYRARRVQ